MDFAVLPVCGGIKNKIMETKDLECPYCGKELDLNHDDGFGYEEGIKHEMECKYCGKSFVFETSVLFFYEPEKANCLNDGKHNYKITQTYPNEFSKMECSICGKRRKLTNDERKHFKIGTIKNYFKKLK